MQKQSRRHPIGRANQRLSEDAEKLLNDLGGRSPLGRMTIEERIRKASLKDRASQ